jgi:integration host factor subunit beta
VTKADLIEEVSRAIGMTRKESEVIVEAIFDTIGHALRRDEKVKVRGFGSFGTHQRGLRVGRNPRTGASVEVPPKKVAHFKIGKAWKKAMNAGHRPAVSEASLLQV